MIKSLTNTDKSDCPEIFDDMFRARAAVFHDRLGWDVRVRDGREIDRYDEDEDPIYLVSLDDVGRPTGSLRLLPTAGEIMLRNEFAPFFDQPIDLRSLVAWECTRFCVHPRLASRAFSGKVDTGFPQKMRPGKEAGERDRGRQISSELLIGLCEFALSSGIEQIVGLYDHAMTRVYRRIGWSPSPFATSRPQAGRLVVGIWNVSRDALATMTARASCAAGDPGFDRRAA